MNLDYKIAGKLLGIIVVLGLGTSIALGWTGNSSTPPANNAPAPINVGSFSQTKGGPLWASFLGSQTNLYVVNNATMSRLGVGTKFGGNNSTNAPVQALEVDGAAAINGGLNLWGQTNINGILKITTSPFSGYVLTSDSSGNATWKQIPAQQAPAGCQVTAFCNANSKIVDVMCNCGEGNNFTYNNPGTTGWVPQGGNCFHRIEGRACYTG